MSGERLGQAQFLGNNTRHTADRRSFRISGFPVSCHCVAHVEAFHSIGEIAHEIPAAQFAIGDKFKAKFFLFGQDMLDMKVFEAAQAVWILPGIFSRL